MLINIRKHNHSNLTESSLMDLYLSLAASITLTIISAWLLVTVRWEIPITELFISLLIVSGIFGLVSFLIILSNIIKKVWK
jgi:heme/copper-type cytochrome/quinol oxidase subunit 4